MLGGEISLESELGAGSKFIFTIKARKGSPEPPARVKPGINKRNLRILAVDDSKETREYFMELMARLNLLCDVARDGEEALRMIEEAQAMPYNIFFVDWLMPGMDGIELTRRIKEMSPQESVVVMISAARWSDIQIEATQAGADRFIPKPLFPSALVNCINECLGAPTNEPGPKESSPDGTPDYHRHTILLAEDVEINQEIVISLLEGTRVSIDCADNGEIALRMFERNPERYSLVFMDIHMPVMDGYEATERIRALDAPAAKRVPIIAMTANAFKEDVERCLVCGMNDHISKPVDHDLLLQKMAEYLS